MRATPTRNRDGVPVPEVPIGEARPRAPRITSLSAAACKSILARNHVGRLAYSFKDNVDIVPIHYVYHDGWLYGRTSTSDKLTTLRHHQWVAFEVDEIEDLFEWRSVVVRGGLYQLSDDLAQPEVREHATDVLRKLLPSTFTADDPVPFRTELFRIHVDSMTGRRATLGKR
jgi:nitroimidazol reductase NimA-like FMN-containing flavoprotein (pyridoxamine 5'-phosphate oxidase superfamily)